jgi:hypothetical protein
MTEDKTLTPVEVEEIRLMSRTPGKSYKAIAEKYGVDEGHIKFIANRERKSYVHE